MAHHELDDADHRSAGARAAHRRHRHAATARSSAFATRRRSHMFDRGRTTRFDLAGHAVIHTAPNVKKVGAVAAHPAGYAPICVGTTTSARMERFTRPLMAQVRRAHHHRQGRPAARRRSPHSASWAAPISRSSAAPRRSRRRGSRRSRTSISTTSIPKACGNFASAISARCWWRWTATAAACTTRSTPSARRSARRCSRRSASSTPVPRTRECAVRVSTHAHRHPDPRLRRRRAVRRAARARRRSRARRSRSPSRACSASAAARAWCRAATTSRSRQGDSVERHFMDTIEGGKWLPDQDLAWTLVNGAIERIHELENELGCFFDRNPDGTHSPEGVRRPDVRPHRAQGRSDRHRDHQPARRAGVGARHRAARGASRARVHPQPRTARRSPAC